MSKKLTRRNFLELLGASTTSNLLPVGHIINVLSHSIFEQAVAQEAGVQAKKYINYQSSGAPPRWFFDAMIEKSSPFFKRNNSVVNKYTAGSRYTEAEYATTQVNLNDGSQMELPYLWGLNTAGANGQIIPAKQLIQSNALFMRGVHNNITAHLLGQRSTSKRIADPYSIGGLVADSHKGPFPAIFHTNNCMFSSPSNLTPVVPPTNGNRIRFLLQGFEAPANSTTFNDPKNLKDLVDKAVNKISARQKEYAPSMNLDLETSKKQMTDAIIQFSSEWDGLLNKYTKIIKNTFKTNKPGINDKPIGNGLANQGQAKYYNSGTGSNKLYHTANDLNTLFKDSSTIPQMASNFALTEFLILNDFSSSIHVGDTALVSLSASLNGGAPQNFNRGHDIHSLGYMPVVLMYTNYYLALIGCLHELTNQLKAKGKFKDTVIHVSGDFNRMPRNNGEGSDHSGESYSTLVLSGGFENTLTVGNIYDQLPTAQRASRTQHVGSWGLAAPVSGAGINNTPMELAHVHATICHILNISPIAAQFSSVVKLNGDKLTSLVGAPKMKEQKS